MKKITALIALFVITFTSSFATVGQTIEINEYDILETEMFYINWQWYVKEDWALKRIDWIEFYSVAGARYIKKNWKIEKLNEWTIHTVNWVNYVKINWSLKTLSSYIKENPVSNHITGNVFSDIFKIEKNEELELSYLSETKIEKIKSETLEAVSTMILEHDSSNTWTVKMLTKSNQKELFYSKLKDYYFELWETEIAKKLFILENIEKIDVQKVNRAISAKLNDVSVTYKQSEEDKDTELNSVATSDATIEEEVDEEFNEFMDLFWGELDTEEDFDFNSAEELDNINTSETTETNIEKSTSEDDIEDEDIDALFEAFWL